MESLSNILFHAEDVQLPPAVQDDYKVWIYKLIKSEGYTLEELHFIFCSDEFLHTINRQYLEHDDYTDIITFDNSEESGVIEGDIFISLERILENSGKFRVAPADELKRVMAHGVLHLCGYGDKTEEDQAVMRGKEDNALNLSAEYIL